MVGRVLVTGATGFIGTHLCPILAKNGWEVRKAVRHARNPDEISIGTIDGQTDWNAALDGCDTVVHLAGRAHVLREGIENPTIVFHRINVEGVKNLAEQAVIAGIKRFVHLSSIGVHGDETASNQPFNEADPTKPTSLYALSKLHGEEALWDTKGTMEKVVLRPPLVYGPGVKANFYRLMQLATCGLPIPLKSVKNARDIIFVENLVSGIETCMQHPDAANETFVIRDGIHLSTAKILKDIARNAGKKCWLVPFPVETLYRVAKKFGKGIEIRKLSGSLQVDDRKIRTLLDWVPPYSYDDGLEKTVKWFMHR
ncbi:MAG: NAD-dependent epimerase/dehydratase family protein [Rickettsiales bacterium]